MVSEEEQIVVLMAREVVEEVCSAVGEANRPRCREVLHRILVEGAGLERLAELPEDCRRAIKEKLRELGVE